MKDYYQILGVAPSADIETIVSAYRALIRQLHPDITDDPDAADKVREVNAAYSVLKDHPKRRQYDRELEDERMRAKAEKKSVFSRSAERYAAQNRREMTGEKKVWRFNTSSEGIFADDRVRENRPEPQGPASRPAAVTASLRSLKVRKPAWGQLAQSIDLDKNRNLMIALGASVVSVLILFSLGKGAQDRTDLVEVESAKTLALGPTVAPVAPQETKNTPTVVLPVPGESPQEVTLDNRQAQERASQELFANALLPEEPDLAPEPAAPLLRTEPPVQSVHLVANIRQPDLSGLGKGDRQAIERICFGTGSAEGSAGHNSCLANQLSSLNAAPARPDLSALRRGERTSIEMVCLDAKTREGPGSYNRCLSGQLASLRASPGRPDFSGLSRAQRQSVETVCQNAKVSDGPVLYNRCLEREIDALGL